jgi:hypothetical protein
MLLLHLMQGVVRLFYLNTPKRNNSASYFDLEWIVPRHCRELLTTPIADPWITNPIFIRFDI